MCKTIKFFDLRRLNDTMMFRIVPPVLPRNFAAFWIFFKCRNEIPYFGRGRKMYQKALKNE